MKVILTIAIHLIFLFQGCKTQVVEQHQQSPGNVAVPTESADTIAVDPDKPSENAPSPADFYDIKGSIGLVGLRQRTDDKFHSIRIYNQDGSLWYEVALDDEDAATKSIKANEDFHPFRADTNYLSTFSFKCIGQDRQYYHVIVNDETGLTKFIKKDDPNFKLGTWEQYILDCFAISFDPANNPLLEAPDGKVIPIGSERHVTYRPEVAEGEWLKVRWHPNDDSKQDPKFGWVKWKEDNKIIIFLFEMA